MKVHTFARHLFEKECAYSKWDVASAIGSWIFQPKILRYMTPCAIRIKGMVQMSPMPIGMALSTASSPSTKLTPKMVNQRFVTACRETSIAAQMPSFLSTINGSVKL